MRRSLLFHHWLSHIPFSIRRRVLRGCISRFFTSSFAFTTNERLGTLFPPFGLTFRRCKIHFMLRTIDLRFFHRSLLRFNTSSYPEALGDSYMALWRLPWPDFHWLVNNSFSRHTICKLDLRTALKYGHRHHISAFTYTILSNVLNNKIKYKCSDPPITSYY